jgi:hypothetical protein
MNLATRKLTVVTGSNGSKPALKSYELMHISANDQAIAIPTAAICGTLMSSLLHHRQHLVKHDKKPRGFVCHIRQNKTKSAGFYVARI